MLGRARERRDSQPRLVSGWADEAANDTVDFGSEVSDDALAEWTTPVSAAAGGSEEGGSAAEVPNQLRRFETTLAALDIDFDGDVESEAVSLVAVSFEAMEAGFEGDEGGRRLALELDVRVRGRDETEEIEGARLGLRFIDGIKSSAEVVERVG